MDDPSLAEIGFKILLILFFVFANGFFVLSEFALVTVRKSWVETLAKKGHRRAQTLLRVVNDLDNYIAATQLGITIASLALGWIGEPALAALFRPLFERLPTQFLPAAAAHTTAIGVAFVLITFLHVVMGELAPKTMALERTERMALGVALPMLIFYYLFYPFVKLLNRSGLFFLRLLRLPPAGEHRAMYAEEIQQMINLSGERGLLEAHARQWMTNVLDFSGLLVRNVMRPRGQVTAIEVSTPLDEIIRTFAQTGYSRSPVYREQLDNIMGVLYSKDLLLSLRHPEKIQIESLLRPALFVPDGASVGEVLRLMLHSKTHFAIVVDEYGAFDGVVSLEDLLEELVGEIRDEHDVEEEARIIKQHDGSWLLDGLLTVREVNRRLHLNIPESDEYATVAGFLMTKTGRLPAVGERITHQDLIFIIQQIKGRRIARVKVESLSRTLA
ncbi:MAG: HlyC/CorC family transporter [Acidobacteria bacterium]|nr:HlyC/CorC family transporter [Acidobacteriota bacterium]